MKRLPEGTATVRTGLTQNELEVAIDVYGVNEILSAMSRICDDKAEYIEVSYNDKSTAQQPSFTWRMRSDHHNNSRDPATADRGPDGDSHRRRHRVLVR